MTSNEASSHVNQSEIDKMPRSRQHNKDSVKRKVPYKIVKDSVTTPTSVDEVSALYDPSHNVHKDKIRRIATDIALWGDCDESHTKGLVDGFCRDCWDDLDLLAHKLHRISIVVTGLLTTDRNVRVKDEVHNIGQELGRLARKPCDSCKDADDIEYTCIDCVDRLNWYKERLNHTLAKKHHRAGVLLPVSGIPPARD